MENGQYEILNQNLRNAQLRMVAMLADVDRICRKHGLLYWIDYGTLLGAKRHDGHIIPWDDDMDICMPSEDYHKFKAIAPAEMNKDFFLQTMESDPESQVGIGNMRVRDNNSLYIFGNEDFRANDNKGIFMDIFEMVACPKLPFKMFRFLARRVSFSYNFFRYNPKLNFHNIVCYFWYPIQYAIFKTLWKCLPLDKNTIGPTPEVYGYSPLLKKDDLYPLQEIDFEGIKVYAPKDIDKRLRGTYGDYMQIPSPDKRRVHVKYIVCDLSSAKVGL